MTITLRHLWAARARRSQNSVREEDYFNQQNGMVTLQYPQETMPIPDNGRYRLHNEMDDCIVCDKCAKVCPVDCIDIEPIKATGEVGKASDGSPIRLYAAKFDIDMAKCCYCGLCTTVCPTECLTMTKTFDYSEFDVRDMNYHYANLNPEQAEEKKALYERFMKEKEELKRMSEDGSQRSEVGGQKVEDGSQKVEIARPKPAFKPTIKPTVPKTELGNKSSEEGSQKSEAGSQKPKPVFAPKKPTGIPSVNIEKEEAVLSSEQIVESDVGKQKSKPIFKPTKPKPTPESTEVPIQKENTDSGEVKPRPKPVFKPTMKPKKEE